MDTAFKWIENHNGICSDDDYPYISGSGRVPFCKRCKPVPGTEIKTYVDVPHTVEDLMQAVSKQPVSIAIEADQAAFQFYNSGVVTGVCGEKLDHGVLLVGYGTTENGIPYWKVKNSWGSSWGDHGYVLIERSDKNLCGVLLSASYPVL